MKMKIWALPVLVALAACSRTSANDTAPGNNAAEPANTTASAAPAPAQAAQPSAMPPGLDCIRNRLSPEDRHGAAEVAMEQGSRDDPRAQPLLQAAEACGDELSWSPQKRRLAAVFSMTAAGAAGIREELGGRGVRIEELDPTILSDGELMAAAASGELGAAGQAFAARHIDEIQRVAAGQPLEGEIGTRIGNYIAFRALAETLSAQFGRTP